MTAYVLPPHLYYMEGVYLCCNESGINSFKNNCDILFLAIAIF